MDILTKFVEEVKAVYGKNLLSIILYGSRASGEETKKYSDYNLLIVLEEIKFSDLKLITRPIKNWVKQGNPAPLFFTSARLKTSADVFPIEFLDIKDKHKVLFGDDLFLGLEIKHTHLRHECEFELKGKLLKLRQGYILSGNKPKLVRKLLIDSLSAVLVVFRHSLRLFGQTPPLKKIDSLELLAKRIGLDASVFLAVHKMKNGDKEANKIDPDGLMEKYLQQIEKVVEAVDNLKA
ncbi:MAG: nucleotidyltransferase domain-containing protein [Elusimicrobiota bacterium]